MALKDQIKAAGLPRREVAIPEWTNGDGAALKIGVRGLTCGEAFDMAEMRKTKSEREVMAHTVVIATYDPADNSPVFETADDVLGISQSALRDIAEAVAELSGVGKQAVETAQKNLSTMVN